MNGRIIFERLKCRDDEKPRNNKHQHYIRININDAIVALPNCTSGPGSSCSLEGFLAMVQRRGRQVGDFREVCGLGDDAERRIDFLHQ